MPVTNEPVWGRIRAGCRVGLRCLGGLALVVALTAATCTSGVGVSLKTTPASLAEVAARTGRESYRTETAVWFGDTLRVPLATGAVDGDLFASAMDMERVVRAVYGDLPDRGPAPDQDTAEGDGRPPTGDMTVDLVTDCSALYVKSSFYAQLQDLDHNSDKDSAKDKEIRRLGKEWARIDQARFPGLRPVDVSRHLTGYANPDPRELLRLLSDVTNIQELGDKTVRGEPLGGLTAEVPMAALLQVLGKQPTELMEHAHGGYTQELIRRTLQLTVPVEVWINDDGLIQQISFELEPDHIAEATGEDRTLVAQRLEEGGIVELDRLYTVDFFGYDETVTITVPDEAFEPSKEIMMPSSAAR